jgi:hypothetical protein
MRHANARETGGRLLLTLSAKEIDFAVRKPKKPSQ